MDGTPRQRLHHDSPFTDVETAPDGQQQASAPVKPAKQSKAASPLIPRAIALLAICCLLAIPVVVPLVVMKMTGTSGKKNVQLEDAIEAPPVIQQVTPPEETSPQEQKESFLKIRNATFERFCRPYYATGFNAYELVETSMVSKRAETIGDLSGAQIVDDTLRQAAEQGLNTIRMWAHTTSDVFPFQTAPGVYDERGLKALDFVLETARKYGLQVILSFIDNWKYYNGVDQYMDWSTSAPPRPAGTKSPSKDLVGDYDDAIFQCPNGMDLKRNETFRHAMFFKDPGAINIYKKHVAFMINRVNSFNGRAYKDDPTIIAWNLINEPRCEDWVDGNADCPSRVQNWLDMMSKHVRNLDPNHLITVGSEGFYGKSTPALQQYNPQTWAAGTGQDYVNNTNLPNIDFGTVHAWPDNWMIKDNETAGFLDRWIQSHISAGAQLRPQKPIMFEEFGKKLTADQQGQADLISNLRDPVYNSVYSSVQRAIDRDQPIAGSMFWKLAIPVFEGQNYRGEYGVMFDDSTMKVIQSNADYIKRRHNSMPPRPDCGIGAWFPAEANGQKDCVNNPDAGAAFYAIGTPQANDFSQDAVNLANKLKSGQTLVYPTKASCCKPGTGFWPEGCSASS